MGNDVDFFDSENDVINFNKNNNNNLTEEEKKIINKLKKLGNFNEEQVIQAFLICDKNEELTANYIFEHMDNSY